MKKMSNFTDEDRKRYTTIWNELENHFDEKSKTLKIINFSLQKQENKQF